MDKKHLLYREYLEKKDSRSFNKRLDPILIGVLTNKEPVIYYETDSLITVSEKDNPLFLSGEGYAHFNFSDCDLSYAQVEGQYLAHGVFSHAILDFANFKESNLSGAVFTGARLYHTNLGLCDLSYSNFSHAHMTKVLFTKKIELSHQGTVFQSFYKTAHLAHTIFQGAWISSVDFYSVRFEHVNLSEASLYRLLFSNNYMYHTVMSQAHLRHINFYQVNAGNLKLDRAHIQDSKFYGSSFQACDFAETQFTNVTFTSLECLSSSFKNCTFTDCFFSSDTVMEDCDFTGATFNKCTLYTENNFFKFSTFENVHINHSTIGTNNSQVSHSFIDSGSMSESKLESAELFLEREQKIQEYLKEKEG